MIPVRARLSQLRQQFILRVRWWFRLEIDDIKAKQVQDQIDGLVELHEKARQTIESAVRTVSQIEARLQSYERAIPRMRMLRVEFEREQARLRLMANGASDERKTRLEHGVIGAVGQ